ncbi:MAG: transposase [Burkholderiales bacterium]|nr:transposase [Burkholderiales bacterium]
MARLARLAVAGQAHYLIQRGLPGTTVFADEVDRQAYLAALREAAAAEAVRIHAWALLAGETQLLATPAQPGALGRMVQALGRRYVAAHNRRHGRRGTLWDGRFRCALVEPGATRLDILRMIDGAAPVAADASAGADPAASTTSAASRLGAAGAGWLVDPPEYWQLGNTPFEREAAYRALLDAGLNPERAAALRAAALGGWVAGRAEFAAAAGIDPGRPAQARPRGRPRRGVGERSGC